MYDQILVHVSEEKWKLEFTFKAASELSSKFFRSVFVINALTDAICAVWTAGHRIRIQPHEFGSKFCK